MRQKHIELGLSALSATAAVSAMTLAIVKREMEEVQCIIVNLAILAAVAVDFLMTMKKRLEIIQSAKDRKEKAKDSAKPQHKVTLPSSFLDTTLVKNTEAEKKNGQEQFDNDEKKQAALESTRIVGASLFTALIATGVLYGLCSALTNLGAKELSDSFFSIPLYPAKAIAHFLSGTSYGEDLAFNKDALHFNIILCLSAFLLVYLTCMAVELIKNNMTDPIYREAGL